MKKVLKQRWVDRKQTKEINVLKKQVKILAKTSEKKYRDLAYSSFITDTPTYTTVNQLTIYSGQNQNRHAQREGETIVNRSFKARGLITMPPITNVASTGTTKDARVRLMLVLYPNAAVNRDPDRDDILEASNRPFDSYLRIHPEVNYKVLWDKTFNLQNSQQYYLSGGGAINGTCTEKFRIPFSINVKLGKEGKKSVYSTQQSSGDIAPDSNQLVLMYWSDVDADSTTAPTHAPRLEIVSRFRFDDN